MPIGASDTRYLIFRPHTRAPEECSVKWLRKPALSRMRSLIEPLLGNNYMEHISVLYLGHMRDMFVAEEGKLHGMRYNERATEIYHNLLLKHHEGPYPTDPKATLGIIVGVAVLFPDRRVWF